MPVFHDRDCDLSIIRTRRVAVIGYGSQGRTHALNLRDSGVDDIVVGLKAGSATRAKAERHGGGWRLNGTKLWTSGAHRAHYMIGLFRTSTESTFVAAMV